MLKKILVTLSCLFTLVACSENISPDQSIKVGTIAGPETELMEVAKKVAKEKYDLDIKIIQFNDYIMPNQALADGSIDANMFQHQPYLDSFNMTKGTDLVAVGSTFVYPLGIYSNKYTHLKQIPKGALVAIPNDPSNGARALLLMQKAKLITLKSDRENNISTLDITNNPKKLVFKELDAAQLARSLADVDIAIINTNYSMLAGLLPSRDALFVESADSPYANIIVARTDNMDTQAIQDLVKALNSPEVQAKADKLFQGQAIPAWKDKD